MDEPVGNAILKDGINLFLGGPYLSRCMECSALLRKNKRNRQNAPIITVFVDDEEGIRIGATTAGLKRASIP